MGKRLARLQRRAEKSWDAIPSAGQVLVMGGAGAGIVYALSRLFRSGPNFESGAGVDAVVVNGQTVTGPGGVPWRNWQTSPDVANLSARGRDPSDTNEIVVHESVTKDWQRTQDILQNRELGVHIMIEKDGTVTQHADLGSDVTYHVPEHNSRSIGVEIINLYEPRHDRSARRIDDAPWAHGDSYILPPLAQVRSLCAVFAWAERVLGIPRDYRGWIGDRYYLDQLPTTDAKFHPRGPGIWSHQNIGGHSDGGWPVLVCALAEAARIPVDEAYERAVELATGARDWVEMPSSNPRRP